MKKGNPKGLLGETTSKWVAMSDKEPPRDELYLVYAPSCDPDRPFMGVAWYDRRGFWYPLPKAWAGAVTHWATLPLPPKEGG